MNTVLLNNAAVIEIRSDFISSGMKTFHEFMACVTHMVT